MGKITVVGIGPGNLWDMTLRARNAIAAADVVVGYNTYIDLIQTLLEGKKIVCTGMMGEIERCRVALQEAAQGADTVIISSGDAGVYGMAGLALELLLKLPEDQRPEFGGVIAGVSAVNAAASLLGAPLMHDFAVISLSNLLTPWEKIEKRVELAAQGDFVIALYNPKSHKRVQNIEIVRDILLKYRKPETPVGIVTDASRANEHKVITTLAEFTQEEITMVSIVIIGNSETYVQDGYMITPRGYQNKEQL